MVRADEMRRLADNIVGTYETRVADIGAIRTDTARLLGETVNLLRKFGRDGTDMAKELRATFSESSSARKGQEAERKKEASADKKARLAEIKALADEVRKQANDVAMRMEEFRESHRELATQLRATFSESRSVREKEKADLKKEFLADKRARLAEKESRLADLKVRAAEVREQANTVARMLETFDKTSKEKALELRKELEETKQVLKKEVSELLTGIRDLVGELSKERQETAAIWQNMVETIRTKRGMAPLPSRKPAREKVPVAVLEEREKEEESEDEGLTIEGRIIASLEDHPDGLRVGEMEELLGVPRTRLGVICKRLWEEGEIRKEDNIYYPAEEG